MDNGTLSKIKNGLYILAGEETARGFYEVELALPGSVICLASAMDYYGLSTYQPRSIHVAVPRTRRRVVPDYPPTQVFSFSGPRYSVGIDIIEIEGHPIRIYDREKTLCDIIWYRNRMGYDLAGEAFREYIGQPSKNVDRLLDYASRLRMRGSVEMYARILL